MNSRTGHRCWAPLALLGALLAACSPPATGFSGTPLLPVSVSCLGGLVGRGDGLGCEAPEPASCPAGTAAWFGEAACAPVGASCPPGFRADPSGVGCLEARVGAPCTGPTRESPTSADCLPIGDCGAPFPPAGALLVDDDFSSAQLDATHFRSIATAVHRAAPGAVIAVEAGTYAEPIIDPLDPVTIVGRCAAQVKVVGTGGNQVALYSFGASGVVVRGLTITGHQGGVFADSGELLVEDSVIEGNAMVGVFSKNGGRVTLRRTRISNVRYRAGGELGAGVVANTGSTVVLEDCAVTDVDHRGLSVGGPGSVARVSGSFIGRSRAVAVSDPPAGVLAVDSSTLSLVGSVVLDVDGTGVSVSNATALVQDSVLRGVHGRLASKRGLGVWGSAGADVRLSNTTIADAPVIGLYFDEPGTRATVEDCSVRGAPPGAVVEIGRGAQVASGATLTLRRSAVAGTSSAGVAFQQGGLGHLDHVCITDVREIGWPTASQLYGGFGLLVEDSSVVDAHAVTVERGMLSAISVATQGALTLDGALVRSTRLSTASSTGSGFQVAQGGRLQGWNVRLFGNTVTSVVVALGGTAELSQSTVMNTVVAPDRSFGHGATVFGRSSLSLTDVLVAGNPGVALVVDDGQARIQGGELRGNVVALHVQNGAYLKESDENGPLATGELRVSSTTAFIENAARVGVGVVPLPQVK